MPKGLAKLDPQVREILRAALAQARYMQVPASAAVNEAVKLTRTFKKASASGLVNAVLRRAIGYDLGSAVFADEVERLMVLGSAGRDVAAFLHENNTSPTRRWTSSTRTADGGLTSLRANPLKGPPEALCEKLLASGAKTAAPGLVPGSVFRPLRGEPGGERAFPGRLSSTWRGRPASLPPSAWRQSPAIPSSTSAPPPAASSLLRIEEMGDEGRLVSCDVSEYRVQLIRKAVERMGFAGRLRAPVLRRHQGRTPACPWRTPSWWTPPAAALGILAKKPDIRYKTLEKARHDELFGHPVGHSGYSRRPPERGRASGLLHLHHRPCRERRAGAGLRGPHTRSSGW